MLCCQVKILYCKFLTCTARAAEPVGRRSASVAHATLDQMFALAATVVLVTENTLAAGAVAFTAAHHRTYER